MISLMSNVQSFPPSSVFGNRSPRTLVVNRSLGAVCCRASAERQIVSSKHIPAGPATSNSDHTFNLQRCLFQHVTSLTDPASISAALPVAAVLTISLLALPEAALASDTILNTPALHHPVSADINNLAAQEEFWSNVLQYVRYFFSVMLGTAYVMTKPFVALFQRPVTAVLAVAVLVSAFYFVSFTVQAMLGITDPVGYEPSSIVTPYSYYK